MLSGAALAVALTAPPALAQDSPETLPAGAPAPGAPPDGAAGDGSEIAFPPEAADLIPRRTYAQADRMTFALMAAAVPGSAQLIQGRWLPGGLHLGSALALGAVGLAGWAGNVNGAKWIAAIGLLGLSIYSPIDAYFAEPPEPAEPARGGRR